jgi:diguanylate cyclase (GGDEF)-like protein
MRPLTVAYLDLDDFKTVNDTLGHEAGDDLLRTIVELMQANIRPADMLARTGGDEFVLVFPETDYVGGGEVLRRLHSKIQSEITRSGWPISCSLGAITFNVLPSSPDALVKRADELMYSVKLSGKGSLKHEQWPAAAGSA